MGRGLGGRKEWSHRAEQVVGGAVGKESGLSTSGLDSREEMEKYNNLLDLRRVQ